MKSTGFTPGDLSKIMGSPRVELAWGELNGHFAELLGLSLSDDLTEE